MSKQYQCNNTIHRPDEGLHYNFTEIISEQEYLSIPREYQKWFAEVGKPLRFYCQNICGREDFSIDAWNKLFRACNNMGLSERERERIMEPVQATGKPCKEQCFQCIAIVGARRSKTNQLTDEANNPHS